MSWGSAWSNGWGSSFGDSIALSVADAGHQTSSDGLALSSISLLVSEARHVSSVDAFSLGVIGLLVSEPSHAHSSDAITLAQSVNNVASWGSSWGVSFGVSWGAGTSLVVADSRHVGLSDPVTLAGISLFVAGTDHPISSDHVAPLVASNLSVSESAHVHRSDALALSQSNPLSASDASHGHLVDSLGSFSIPELILNGVLLGGEPFPIRMSGVQCVVIPGTNLYAQAPVLQSSSVTVWDGQIAIQYSGFHFEDIGSDYLVILYKPGSPRVGGGPFPATMVDASTNA